MSVKHADALPIVHLNGTSRNSLVEQRFDVVRALRKVLDELSHMSPNGRDYYLEPGRWGAALKLHRERTTVIQELSDEIEAEALALADGENG